MEHVSIWGTPFPTILNQKNSTGSAGGAKNSQNGGILVPPNGPIWLKQIYRDMKFILRGLPERCANTLIVLYDILSFCKRIQSISLTGITHCLEQKRKKANSQLEAFVMEQQFRLDEISFPF